MSEENLEIVRRGIEVVNRGELDAILGVVDEVADPNIEMRAVGRLPDTSRVLRGPKAVKAWWAQILETFDWHWEPEELIDAGDAVVVVSRQIARGRGSGAEVANRVVGVFTFRDGKVISIDAYPSKAQALEAAGLSE